MWRGRHTWTLNFSFLEEQVEHNLFKQLWAVMFFVGRWMISAVNPAFLFALPQQIHLWGWIGVGWSIGYDRSRGKSQWPPETQTDTLLFISRAQISQIFGRVIRNDSAGHQSIQMGTKPWTTAFFAFLNPSWGFGYVFRLTIPHFIAYWLLATRGSNNPDHWSRVHPLETSVASIPFTNTVGVTWTDLMSWVLNYWERNTSNDGIWFRFWRDGSLWPNYFQRVLEGGVEREAPLLGFLWWLGIQEEDECNKYQSSQKQKKQVFHRIEFWWDRE